jgi:hypothetical protein
MGRPLRVPTCMGNRGDTARLSTRCSAANQQFGQTGARPLQRLGETSATQQAEFVYEISCPQSNLTVALECALTLRGRSTIELYRWLAYCKAP